MDEEAGDGQWIAKINALLRFHYKVEPERLSDREWAKLFNEYVYVRDVGLRDSGQVMKSALAEVLGKMMEGMTSKIG